jgi:Eco57I restriction-modification methylase
MKGTTRRAVGQFAIPLRAHSGRWWFQTQSPKAAGWDVFAVALACYNSACESSEPLPVDNESDRLPMIQGGLFTRDFLLEGITAEPVWRALSADVLERARARLEALLAPLVRQRAPNEAETETHLVFPTLEHVLGWAEWLPQQNQSAAGRSDVPDALLFGDAATLERARGEPAWQRFQHGLCLVESKRWNRPLDRPVDGRDRRAGEEGVPSAQILRYLRRADDVTHGGLRWGILTNGRLWRLYWQGALSVSEDFLEIDLGKVFGLPGCEIDLLDPRGIDAGHALKLFLVLFGRPAFLTSEHGRTFHAVALEQGRRWEEKVARDLSRVVFHEVFPVLAAALARHDRGRPAVPNAAWLEQIRQGSLILLYRLLFVLYSEDRDLLPDERGPYAAYSLTRIRREVADARAVGRTPSPHAAIYWARLRGIFNAIAHGDDGLGIPPYNGGLFETDAAPVLERLELPDDVVAKIVFALSYVEAERGPKYVNYRDLSVQQLGSIYERILEFGLALGEDGSVVIDRDDDERHDSGSYYTPEALVSLIIERAVGPTVADRARTFEAMAEQLKGDRRSVAVRLAELAAKDPASALLELKVCDPAMGSGHFLVSLVDWLADRVLAALAEAPAQITWGEYASPLLTRVAAIRARILEQAQVHGWQVTPDQLDDRHVIRRMILKRVVHGVDKNPFAVELAKVALWLHTFTVGAPLSFLDHHLRCGDSIVGAWVRPTLDAVAQGGGLLAGGEIARVEAIAATMTQIEEITDNDVSEVKASSDAFGVVEDATRELDAFFSLMTARHALGVDLSPDLKRPRFSPEQLRGAKADVKRIAAAEKQQAAYDRAAAFKAVLEPQFGDPLRIATGEAVIAVPNDDGTQPMLAALGEADQRRRMAAALVADARALTRRERFLHWPVAFPNTWRNLTRPKPDGGFDAVIGNPPYVHSGHLSAIKSALAASYKTFAGTADLYVYFFEQGLRLVRPGGRVGYVVTNKWLKAGYAEELRAMLTDPARAETEAVIDFGHARAFFPDADVFPNVVVVRRPDGTDVPESLTVAVPSRETLPDERLEAAIGAASFQILRSSLGREGWALEPKPVMDLLAKIRRAGLPLVECADVKPYRGVLTGFNEAFVIDTPTRDRLVAADPASAEIIKPYLRGQDVQRWSAPDSGLHMILLKSSSDYAWPWATAGDELAAEATFATTYPALHAHMKLFESVPGDRPGELKGLRHREDHGRYWWELRPCAYYNLFNGRKLLYVDICWTASFLPDRGGRAVSNTSYFLPGSNDWLAVVLNAPIGWWYSWRKAQRGKDDALRYFTSYVEGYPIPAQTPDVEVGELVDELSEKVAAISLAKAGIHDWLRIEFGLDRPGRILEKPERLDAYGFATAVRAALPRRRHLSAAEIARLKREHAETIIPARQAAAEAQRLERRVSDLVNQAYGLTPEEVALMWATAPPRMPLTPQPT